MFANLSIGKKIVGLSVFLLSIMLASSLYSFVKTNRVRDAAADITQFVVPLSEDLTAIETGTLEQALLLERILRHTGLSETDAAQARLELARFRESGRFIESRLGKSEELLKKGLAGTSLLDNAVQLARVEPEVEALEREHTAYMETAGELIDTLTTGPARSAREPADRSSLIQRLSTQEDRVDETIERLSQRLDAVESSESGSLRGREEGAWVASSESLLLAVAAFLFGAVVSALITRRMVRPVRALISGAEEVSRGNLDVSIESTSNDEVGQLARAFQHMISELRTKARVKETFGKYLDPRIVDRLLASGQPDIAGGEKKVMTVFFSDLQGFSGISELLTPAGLVNLINSYLTLASQPILDHQGVIDKYIGDAIMAFWGPPFYAPPDHARQACLAALAQYDQLAELKRTLPDLLGFRRNIPDMHVRIGLCTGELIVGSIGSNVSKSFTVMGDTVNTASRLESANKQFGTRILIDGGTFDMVRAEMETRELDLLGVVGKEEPVRVYELLGEKGKVEAPRLELRDAFETGLRAYRLSDWIAADRHFSLAAEIDPYDKPTVLFRERVERFQETPPSGQWGGIWRLAEK